MRKLTKTILIAGTALMLGCSEMQQIPMTPPQADAYNSCMSNHWSSFADTALFGVAGYEYHQNQVLNCQQVALTKSAAAISSVAPATTSPIEPAPNVIPAAAPVAPEEPQ
jgi:hypothetical protein